MRKTFLSLLALCAASVAYSQTLFSIANSPVTKQEFLNVYEKNAQNMRPDFSEKALRENLDLYELFRMRVKEANLSQLDTNSSIQSELNGYRKQIAKNYLTDQQVTDRLLHQAYDRLKEEVHIEHIVLLAPPTLNPTDTLRLYNRMDSMYQQTVNKKASFEDMAKMFSEDRTTKDKGGDVGYITALQTVYPFENVAFDTKVGKVSRPFRTVFGFHILKVLDRRSSKGQVQVAQVLIPLSKNATPDLIAAADRRADSVIMLYKSGVSFDTLVRRYSKDQFTNEKNGVMEPFGVGRMVPSFEKAAFELKRPGDISGPIHTDYGVHVIKLIAKTPIKPFDSIKNQLKQKIDNDSRAGIAKSEFFERVKVKNGYKEFPDNFQAIVSRTSAIPDTGRNAGVFNPSDYSDMHSPIFSLGGKDYSQSDFMAYAATMTRGRLMGDHKLVLHDLYNLYQNQVLNDFEEQKLVEENPEFKGLMQEFRNGILIFDLMDKNVWGKASRDTVGLKKFYEANKQKYMWDAGFSGIVYHFKDQAAYNEGMKVLKNSMADSVIVKSLNTESNPDAVSVTHNRFEYSTYKDYPRVQISQGKFTPVTKNGDGTYSITYVDKVYDMPSVKTLTEAKGYVVAEYQDYLEKKWNEELRSKYPVTEDRKVFMSMVK